MPVIFRSILDKIQNARKSERLFQTYDRQILVNAPNQANTLKESLRDSGPQAFLNGEIHDWYRIILGYSDKLVSHLIATLEIPANALVLDPFCGTGTTLVECKKRGICSIGVDANPSSVFASRVKTEWNIDRNLLLAELMQVEARYAANILRRRPFKKDSSYQYIASSGMLERGWISQLPLRKSIALKQAIEDSTAPQAINNLFLLALVNNVVKGASNVKFGPQLYCSKQKKDADVMGGFSQSISRMATDLQSAQLVADTQSSVHLGDSRNMICVSELHSSVDAIVCSPPYPTEHDYTRNSRLELAFLEYVTSRADLRDVKQQMIRSHTKGIYKSDTDSDAVSHFASIQNLSEIIRKATRSDPSGFEKLYPRVVKEYFGGMYKHLTAVKPLLKRGGYAAYVVGDQSSYSQVHIPTAKVIEEMAVSIGFESVAIQLWRSRWATASSSKVAEHIVVLRNPK